MLSFLWCWFLISCTSEDSIEIVVEPEEVKFNAFCFLKKYNPKLVEDVIIELGNDSISECFIHNLPTDSLVATFSGNYEKVTMGGGRCNKLQYCYQLWRNSVLGTDRERWC